MKKKLILSTAILLTISFTTFANEYKTLFSTMTPATKFVGQIGKHCTFTMISPGLAITARHCVDDTAEIEVFLTRGRVSPHHFQQETFIHKVHQLGNKDIAVLEVSPRYERPLSDFPKISTINTDTIRDKMSNVIMWGYPGSLGSQLAEMEGVVHNIEQSHVSGNAFSYEMDNEGGTSGSSVRLKGKDDTIIGIHTLGKDDDEVLFLDFGVAETFSQSEVKEINKLISDTEYQEVLRDFDRISQGPNQCFPDEEYSYEQTCEPEEYNNVESYNLEEFHLETYYDYRFDSEGQSYPQ